MTSLRICSGGNCSLSGSGNTTVDRRNIPNHRRSSVTVARRGAEFTPNVVTAQQQRRISRETIEEWVEGSATEIVKNLPNAPLLIQVIEEAEGRRRLEFQKRASDEMWRSKLKGREIGEGLIVVEELKNGRDSRGVYWNGETVGEEESTKAWGLVVQGKGLECGPVCYLLKTSRVGSSTSNLGCCCTHFCLVRVNDFDQTAERQLASLWLS